MNNVKLLFKLLFAGIFVIGLDIIIPFNTFALNYVIAHGKALLWLIAIINVYVGGGISGGFLDKGVKTGFYYWGKPLQIDGELNPTYAFAGLIAVISTAWVLMIQR